MSDHSEFTCKQLQLKVSLMFKYQSRVLIWLLLALFIGGLNHASAQKKEQYSSLKEALLSAGNLYGSQGPRNINWIDGGDRYSYMQYGENGDMEIRAYTPSSKEDVLVFSNEKHTFPDSDKPFTYNSFQWSEDSKYIVFRSNFRPVYRYSGISDYYLYSIEDESLQLLVEDARTAELSPDGSKIGYERNGDLFVYNLDNKKETRLTDS